MNPLVSEAAKTIRRPNPDELALLPALEADAGRRFADVGMDSVAAVPPPPLQPFVQAHQRDLLWIIGHPQPLGFILLSIVDGHTHIDEVSVRIDASGQGLGRLLIEHACTLATQKGHNRVSLTTFRDVPWNAPYYRRLGFEAVSTDAAAPELQAIARQEAAKSRHAAARIAMIRLLRAPTHEP